MRFINQTTDYDCGPVAILNLMKWCKVRVGKKDLPEFKDLLGTTKPNGTKKRSMHRLLKELIDPDIATLKLIHHISYKRLKWAVVEEGASAILHYTFREKGNLEGHYVFIGTRMDCGLWIIANEHKSDLYYTDRHIQRRISMSKKYAVEWSSWGKTSPFCWLIIPKKEKK